MKAIYTYDKMQFTFAEMRKKKDANWMIKPRKTEGFTISRDFSAIEKKYMYEDSLADQGMISGRLNLTVSTISFFDTVDKTLVHFNFVHITG